MQPALRHLHDRRRLIMLLMVVVRGACCCPYYLIMLLLRLSFAEWCWTASWRSL